MEIEERNSAYPAEVMSPSYLPWFDPERKFSLMTGIFLEMTGIYQENTEIQYL